MDNQSLFSLNIDKLSINIQFINRLTKSDINYKTTRIKSTIEAYRELWSTYIIRQIDNHPSRNPMISNKWAFSTFSGSLLYEQSLQDKDIYNIRPQGDARVKSFVQDLISEGVSTKIQNFFLYGFGGLKREASLIHHYILLSQIKRADIFMFECSPYYYSIAKNWFTSIDLTYKDIADNGFKYLFNQIYLTDFEEDVDGLRSVREKLKNNKPVIHIFFGNVAGNLDEKQLKNLLTSYTKQGDIVILEYADYASDFFTDTSPDYTVALAEESMLELFKDKIKNLSITPLVENESKFLQINFEYQETQYSFKSILRRNFKPHEIHNSSFDEIGERTRTGHFKNYLEYFMQAFKRTSY